MNCKLYRVTNLKPIIIIVLNVKKKKDALMTIP